MSAVDYPAWFFNSEVADGYTEQAVPYNVSFAPESGPAITRRSASVAGKEITSQNVVDHNQLAAFEDYYENQIAGGAGIFWYIKRTTNMRVLARLKDGVYSYSQDRPEGGLVSCTIEILPS
jgi:hypothetical protein